MEPPRSRLCASPIARVTISDGLIRNPESWRAPLNETRMLLKCDNGCTFPGLRKAESSQKCWCDHSQNFRCSFLLFQASPCNLWLGIEVCSQVFCVLALLTDPQAAALKCCLRSRVAVRLARFRCRAYVFCHARGTMLDADPARRSANTQFS